MASPPCSLLGPACASVHKRCAENPEGDQSRYKVRLCQRIWKNFVAWSQECRNSIQEAQVESKMEHTRTYYLQNAVYFYMTLQNDVVCSVEESTHAYTCALEACFLELLHNFKPSLYIVIEQPSGSWGYKQPFMQDITSLLSMLRGRHGQSLQGHFVLQLHVLNHFVQAFLRFICTTWLCYFGHDMLKCTHLQSNMAPGTYCQ